MSLLCAAVSACGSSETDRASEIVKLGPLELEVPAAWNRVDTSRDDVLTSVWTPAGANERKESISVIRVERAAGRAVGMPIDRLLAAAQGSLREARVSASEVLTTAQIGRAHV